MNEKPASGSFRHRIYWYVLITAVIQFLLGVGFAFTAFARGPIALLFLIPMANFAYLLLILFQHGLSYTQYGTLTIWDRMEYWTWELKAILWIGTGILLVVTSLLKIVTSRLKMHAR